MKALSADLEKRCKWRCTFDEFEEGDEGGKDGKKEEESFVMFLAFDDQVKIVKEAEKEKVSKTLNTTKEKKMMEDFV